MKIIVKEDIIHKKYTISTVVVCGNSNGNYIDQSMINELSILLNNKSKNNSRTIIILNLKNIDYIEPGFIELIIKYINKLILTNVTPRLDEIFIMHKLKAKLTFYDSVDDAKNSFWC